MYQKAAHVKLIEKGTDDNVPKQQFRARAQCIRLDEKEEEKKNWTVLIHRITMINITATNSMKTVSI